MALVDIDTSSAVKHAQAGCHRRSADGAAALGRRHAARRRRRTALLLNPRRHHAWQQQPRGAGAAGCPVPAGHKSVQLALLHTQPALALRAAGWGWPCRCCCRRCCCGAITALSARCALQAASTGRLRPQRGRCGFCRGGRQTERRLLQLRCCRCRHLAALRSALTGARQLTSGRCPQQAHRKAGARQRLCRPLKRGLCFSRLLCCQARLGMLQGRAPLAVGNGTSGQQCSPQERRGARASASVWVGASVKQQAHACCAAAFDRKVQRGPAIAVTVCDGGTVCAAQQPRELPCISAPGSPLQRADACGAAGLGRWPLLLVWL